MQWVLQVLEAWHLIFFTCNHVHAFRSSSVFKMSQIRQMTLLTPCPTSVLITIYLCAGNGLRQDCTHLHISEIYFLQHPTSRCGYPMYPGAQLES